MKQKTIQSSNNKRKHITAQFCCLIAALSSIGFYPLSAAGQEGHSHTTAAQHEDLTTEQNALIQVVRDSTLRFKDVAVAKAEGYALQFGCVSGENSGAMGLHYVNGNLVNAGVLDATRPQIVIYEALPGGGLRLIGADYLLLADAWKANHSGPPELMGQLFHLFDSPNRFGLPAFYTLHVWAWKENRNGAFVNWHPAVSCAAYSGQAAASQP